MIKCGLLGRHLAHSYSPQIHSAFGDYPYSLFEKEPEAIEAFLKHGDFTGINVTIPYKKTVVPYCSQLTPVAQRLGAVNTILRQPDGSLLGHNSDYFGFQAMVHQLDVAVDGKKVLVLGSGGASNTVVAVLEDMGAQPVVISRSGDNHYGNLYLHGDAALIVNATPVGMYPNTDERIIDLDAFPFLEAVADLIYNPARTRLIMDAQAKGLKTENGLWMLVAQAKESAQYFTGSDISDSVICDVHRKLRPQMENIILIGMPGCGKTTVGSALAAAMERPFIDTDAQIVSAAGCDIPQIFEKYGEARFRQLETEVMAKLGKESGLIIATGGGCVTKQENYPHLHQNGRIIWLQRAVEKLSTYGRPLSRNSDLGQMFTQRQPMYQRFADIVVSNDHTVENTVNEIQTCLQVKL